jgi:hypothetical protein
MRFRRLGGVVGALGLAVALLVAPGAGVGAASAAARGAGDAPSGGYSFNEASSVRSGSSAEQTLVVGEWLFWKLEARLGQRVEFSAQVTAPQKYQPGPVENFRIYVFDPLRDDLTPKCVGSTDMALDEGGQTAKAACMIGGGAEGNVRTEALRQFGTYYLAVAVIGGAGQNHEKFAPGRPPKGAVIPSESVPPKRSADGRDRAADEGSDGTGIADLVPAGAALAGGLVLGLIGVGLGLRAAGRTRGH